MRAAVYDSSQPEGIHVIERIQTKRSGRNEVLIRVMYAGVNPVDSKFVFGDKLPGVLKAHAHTLFGVISNYLSLLFQR
jgi:NADPH:quinone reductase-like Zn-dependent oxidoreductase